MLSGYHTYTTIGIQRRDTYEEICKWIVTSWDSIRSKCVKNSFKKAETQVYNKKDIKESSSDEWDFVNMENLSNEVLNHLEFFKFRDFIRNNKM